MAVQGFGTIPGAKYQPAKSGRNIHILSELPPVGSGQDRVGELSKRVEALSDEARKAIEAQRKQNESNESKIRETDEYLKQAKEFADKSAANLNGNQENSSSPVVRTLCFASILTLACWFFKRN